MEDGSIEEKAVSFTKEQITNSKRYMQKKDVANVVLKDDQSYSINQVDELIEKFMREKVN